MIEESSAVSEKNGDGGDEPTPVGLKLGSVRTVAARPSEDAVRTEVALTCLATYQDALTGKPRSVYGEEAADQYPERATFMLRSGLPEDDEHATVAQSFLDRFVRTSAIPSNSAVVYAAPSTDSGQGLLSLDTIIEQSVEENAGECLIRGYPESLCGSIPVFGSGLDALDRIFITINMGSTNMEACVYRRGEQLSRFSTVSVTGNGADRWIVNNVEEETNGRVNIDQSTAREYKERHADFDDFEPFTHSIHLPTGEIDEFRIEHSVMDALDRYVDEAVDAFANEFLPQLANRSIKIYKQTVDEPIVLTGGMAAVPGLVEAFEDRLSTELQHEVAVTAPEEPVTAAARGAQRIAGRLIETHMY